MEGVPAYGIMRETKGIRSVGTIYKVKRGVVGHEKGVNQQERGDDDVVRK